MTFQTPKIGLQCHSPATIKNILVVDDSRAQRRILSAYLSRWGFIVHEASSGAEGLAVCETSTIDLIVSDWMMPGMNGLEFCTAFRQLDRENYGYFILLTSNSEKGEVAHGLDVGADDFLTKPVAALELKARIRAGERILKIERELTEKNRLVGETLAEISTLYDLIELDLLEAQALQESLVREKFRDFGNAQVSLLLKPSGHVGGDLVGFFEINENSVGVYSIDVSGHGVASALMTARLAGYLSSASPDQNIALERADDGGVVPRSPAEAAFDINRIVMNDMETELYFTMLLGHFDLNSGLCRLVQCGHPNAAVQNVDGRVEFCGTAGLPVGLIPDANWTDFEIELSPGDRLLLASDGISECPDINGNLLDEAGLAKILCRRRKASGSNLLDTLIDDLTIFASGMPFPDDISAVLFEFGASRMQSVS